MPRADFITGLVFFVIGVYMIVEGTQMPGQEEVSFIEIGGEPGRSTIVVGGTVAFFALVLLLRSISAGGHRLGMRIQFEGDQRIGFIRTVITAVGCSIYAVGIVGASFGGWKVPYDLATGLFIFAFITGFEWESAPELGRRRWAKISEKRPAFARFLKETFGFVPPEKACYVWLMVSAAIQAVLLAVIVTYVFEKEFFVTLP
jgi:putative tricarboxylic transport membrane protein